MPTIPGITTPDMLLPLAGQRRKALQDLLAMDFAGMRYPGYPQQPFFPAPPRRSRYDALARQAPEPAMPDELGAMGTYRPGLPLGPEAGTMREDAYGPALQHALSISPTGPRPNYARGPGTYPTAIPGGHARWQPPTQTSYETEVEAQDIMGQERDAYYRSPEGQAAAQRLAMLRQNTANLRGVKPEEARAATLAGMFGGEPTDQQQAFTGAYGRQRGLGTDPRLAQERALWEVLGQNRAPINEVAGTREWTPEDQARADASMAQLASGAIGGGPYTTGDPALRQQAQARQQADFDRRRALATQRAQAKGAARDARMGTMMMPAGEGGNTLYELMAFGPKGAELLASNRYRDRVLAQEEKLEGLRRADKRDEREIAREENKLDRMIQVAGLNQRGQLGLADILARTSASEAERARYGAQMSVERAQLRATVKNGYMQMGYSAEVADAMARQEVPDVSQTQGGAAPGGSGAAPGGSGATPDPVATGENQPGENQPGGNQPVGILDIPSDNVGEALDVLGKTDMKPAQAMSLLRKAGYQRQQLEEYWTQIDPSRRGAVGHWWQATINPELVDNWNPAMSVGQTLNPLYWANQALGGSYRPDELERFRGHRATLRNLLTAG